MRKLLILMAALGLVVASCGGGDDAGGGSCESVADDAIQVFQELIDELDSMSVDELAALGEEGPPALAEMEEEADALQAQANDLGCSDETMEELFNARVGDLTADGLFGEMIIEGFQEGGFFE